MEDEKKPYIETGVNHGPGYTWEDLKKENHNFPDSCPQWSGAGITQMRQVLSTDLMVVLVVVCTCGVIKKIPLS